MNTKAIFMILGLFLSSTAFGACTTKYDYESGNNYTVCDSGDTTTIRGTNLQNGSIWNQTQKKNGTYSGTDGDGNYYTGDNKTGSYYNYGTGKMCTGTGASRICTN